MNLNCFEYFDRLRSTTSFEDSQKIFSNSLLTIGVNDFGYGEGTKTKNTLTYTVNQLPGQFYQHYAAVGHGIHDPVIRDCMATGMPSLWHQALDITKITENEREFILQYYQLGYIYGVTIPFKGDHNRFYLLTLPLESKQDCNHLIQESLSDLCTLVCFYQNMATVGDTSNNLNLTGRQKDCLMFSGEGYSSKQIAHLIKIKEDTVNKHIEEATRRLGARNRVHAVVILMQNGVIN